MPAADIFGLARVVALITDEWSGEFIGEIHFY